MIKTIYSASYLSDLTINITQFTHGDVSNYDVKINHTKSSANSVVINVSWTSCVLDVLRMALTLYKIEGLIDQKREASVIKGVRKALGYKS